MTGKVLHHDEVSKWLTELAEIDLASYCQVRDAISLLTERGPNLGRPLVDTMSGTALHNLKELRPGSRGRTEVRILFVFDVRRQAIMLVAGDKAGSWDSWYRRNIPLAEAHYQEHLAKIQGEQT